MPPSPIRGDVWLVDLGMAAKTRPCLVLSVPAKEQDRALATIVPHTTSVRGSRFEIAVRARFLRSGGFNAQNLITVPTPRFVRRLGTLSPTELSAVENVVRSWLGFA